VQKRAGLRLSLLSYHILREMAASHLLDLMQGTSADQPSLELGVDFTVRLDRLKEASEYLSNGAGSNLSLIQKSFLSILSWFGRVR